MTTRLIATMYVPMISAMVEDHDRNLLIAGDISPEVKADDNCCLVLSDRKAHLDKIASILQGQGV